MLIDAEELLPKIIDWREFLAENYGKNDEYVKCLGDVIDIIYDTTPIEERKKGEWEEKTVFDEPIIEQWQSARCSVCGLYHTTPFSYYFF